MYVILFWINIIHTTKTHLISIQSNTLLEGFGSPNGGEALQWDDAILVRDVLVKLRPVVR